ncbi:MAG: hypothetical protein M1821_006429 [Bathelium mastoideum]|nr:MAG: hypothetical protein M1821_006429 [Bathelium mastoideum]KAI9693706.1 MAG: hypothetical protein M1822_002977 [Bathelium mastoideum]
MLRRIPDPASQSTTPIHFYCSSGGNAGLACAHAARSLSYPCTVVVPLTTPALMLAKIRAAGATSVIQEGASWVEADTHMRETLMPEAEGKGEKVVYVPPFDDPDIWEGHSSMVDEIHDDLGRLVLEERSGKTDPDAVLCGVGGGGLLCGVVRGLDRHGWGDVPVIALETFGTDSLNQALRKGELKAPTLPAITSRATCLGARTVCKQAFDDGQRENVKSVVLEDAEAAMGCWRLADDERLMVELACGVNVALCYDGRLEKYLGRDLAKDDKVVVIVCGGSNITVEELASYRQEYAYIEKSMPKDADVPSSVSAPNGTHG